MIGLYEPPDAPADELVDQEAEFRVCRMDPAYFIDHFGVIDNVQDFDGPEGSVGEMATTPFRLWPDQVPLFDDLEHTRQLLILKARQLGISWVVCGYILWLCGFTRGRFVQVFSKGQREADEMIRRISALYHRLPQWLRDRLPRLEVDNVRELEWANGSNVKAMPGNKNAGVSFTASLVVMDEAAHMAFGSQLYAAAKPIIDNGGQLVILSSANGFGGFFHTLWRRSARGETTFRTAFLPWWSRPDRDQAWYDRMVQDADDPALVKQNYPANPVEAFVASGRLRFDPAHVARQAVHLRDPFKVWDWSPETHARKFWPGLSPAEIPPLHAVPGLRIYMVPVPGRKYVLAGDVAEGKDPEGKRDSDFDAAVLLDCETWEEAASLHGRWEPDVYGDYLIALAEPYGATIVVERNNHGHAVLLHFRHRKVPFARVGLGHDGWPGWLTNAVTKPSAVTLLSRALREELITVRTAAALYEMHEYSVLKTGDTGAPSGSHDDYVSAWSVGLAWLRSRAAVPADDAPAAGGEPARMTGFLTVR